jgi:hypothetical protein
MLHSAPLSRDIYNLLEDPLVDYINLKITNFGTRASIFYKAVGQAAPIEKSLLQVVNAGKLNRKSARVADALKTRLGRVETRLNLKKWLAKAMKSGVTKLTNAAKLVPKVLVTSDDLKTAVDFLLIMDSSSDRGYLNATLRVKAASWQTFREATRSLILAGPQPKDKGDIKVQSPT